MKGAIIGDIIGSHFEFQPCKEKDFLLFGDSYYYTDDTVLTMAVADVILNNYSYEEALVKWSRKYPNQSWGERYNAWFRNDKREPYNSFGNGSAMRVSPIGWAFDTLEETLKEAKRSAEVTHNHPEGVKGAQAVASAIFLARNKKSKMEIKEYIEDKFQYNLSRKYKGIQPEYFFDATCQGSVPEAIICFLESKNFEDAIRNAVALGGDADTQACITGSIAEAYYGGVPEEIWNKCKEVLEPEMVTLINDFYDKYKDNFSKNAKKEGTVRMYSFVRDRYHTKEEIEKQYKDRIEHLMKSDKNEEQKAKEKEKLEYNLSLDPRRPDIVYDNEETSRKNRRIAKRLDSIAKHGKDNFLTHPYVLEWSDDKPTTWVYFFKTDITKLYVDAIVNAANSTLLGGGGVDGAIHRSAGPQLLEECQKIRNEKYPDGLPTGEAVMTKGYNLPAKFVIHTVGPVWQGGGNKEEKLLYKCYFNSLLLAKENKVETIAFPEISTGAYGYPKDKARRIGLNAIYKFVERYPGAVEEILLTSYA